LIIQLFLPAAFCLLPAACCLLAPVPGSGPVPRDQGEMVVFEDQL